MIDERIWAENLAALTDCHPAVARTLSAAHLPPDIEFVRARDGAVTATWLERTEPAWLGRTQLPLVRAAALADTFACGSGNVVMVGLAGGEEAVQLLTRMHASQALFVVDIDVATTAVALRLRNIAADIRSGRCVVCTGSDQWEQLEQFLTNHGGYLMPDRVLQWPWFSPADTRGIRDRLGAMAARRQKARQTRTAASSCTAAVTTGSSHSARLIVTADLRAGPAALLARALCGRAGSPRADYIADAVPDGPSRRDTNWLVGQFADHPNACLLQATDSPDDIGGRSGLSLPTTYWLTCEPRDWATVAARRPSNTRLVVSSRKWLERAVSAGIAVETTRHIALAGDADGQQPDWPQQVDTSAAAAGIVMASHKALWDAMCADLQSQVMQWRDSMADALLANAESRTGIIIKEPEVRRWLAEEVRSRLGPRLLNNACAAACEGWSDRAAASESRPAIVNHPDEFIGRLQLLNAAAAGRVLLVRRTEPSEWGELLDPELHMSTFDSLDGLTGHLDAILQQPAMYRQRAEAAAAHMAASHRWEIRLAEWRQWTSPGARLST